MWLCSECGKEKSEEAFYRLRRKRGWKVTICFSCAVENMRKWAAGQQVGKKADDIQPVD
jgi:protein-arginine kinase activator protein McsA